MKPLREIIKPLRDSQLNIWYHQVLGADKGAYNMCNYVFLQNLNKPQVFDQAARYLISKSEEFNSVFRIIDGEPVRLGSCHVEAEVSITE